MKLPLLLALVCVGSLAHAADPFQPRKANASAAGFYVPVDLDAHANSRAGAEFADLHLNIASVPFDLVTPHGADNLFLKQAGWPDWQKDPSSYYSAYDAGPKAPGDPERPVLRVPVADYSAIYLLAAADNDRSLGNVVSFRIGALDGARRVALHDFTATVPRFDEEKVPGISTKLDTPAGHLFLVRVPLGLAIAQDFPDEWALDVEVTKSLKLAVREPDPCRFNVRPLGLPSGVHIFGMTFQRSPVQMRVTSDEVGHIFVDPQPATFHVELRSFGRVNGKLALEAVAKDLSGETVKARIDEVQLPQGGRITTDLTLPLKKRGWYEVSIRLLNNNAELLRRETTLALLPPDTRKHRDLSPFGTWDFGGAHYTPSEADEVGPLYVKAGLHYGMFKFTADERRKYGVLAGQEPRSAEALAKAVAADPLQPQRVLVFHENAISGSHVMRTPDVFTGRPPYRLDEKEQQKFDSMWDEALATAKAVREQFPQAKISFGNGNPHLMEEFARHKFPRDLFDSRGNEAGSFMRMPETQPLDFVANNASLWMDRQVLDHYGYQDVPVTQCYEICYPCTNPGNLSLHTQATYYARHLLHSLVWGVPVIRPACITDVGNSYYFSNWGACGLCFAKPDVSPKPAYVAVATLTRVLDGATFSRVLTTGSPSVYAIEFNKMDGGFVTACWTPRGTRSAEIEGSDAIATDLSDNDRPVAFTDDHASIELTADPVFLTSKVPLRARKAGVPPHAAPPKTKATVISSLAKLDDWQIDSAADTELEWFNFDCPRRKGNFAFANLSEFDGEKNVLSVTPHLPVPGSPYLPMYASLSAKQPIEIPGQPTEIALLVNGNGGWGRVIFEVEDAGGQRWTSIGAQQRGEATRWMADWMTPQELAQMKTVNTADWNTNDAWQRSRINFEGWRYVSFPLPGNYDGEGYHWPGNCNWKRTGDGVVKYPLKLKRLIIELPEKILYLNQYVAVPRPEIYLTTLQVTYAPIEQVSAAP